MMRFFAILIFSSFLTHSNDAYAIDFKKALKDTVEKEKKKYEEKQKKATFVFYI